MIFGFPPDWLDEKLGKEVVQKQFFNAIIENSKKPKLEAVLKKPTPPLESHSPEDIVGTRIEPHGFTPSETTSNSSISDPHLNLNNDNLINNRAVPAACGGFFITIVQYAPLLFGLSLIGALVIHEAWVNYVSHADSNNEGSSNMASNNNTTESGSSGQNLKKSTGQSSRSGGSKGLTSGAGGSGDGDDNDPKRWSCLEEKDYIKNMTPEEMARLILDLLQTQGPLNLTRRQIASIIKRLEELKKIPGTLENYSIEIVSLNLYKQLGLTSIVVINGPDGRTSFFINPKGQSYYIAVIDQRIIDKIRSLYTNAAASNATSNTTSLLDHEGSLISEASSQPVSPISSTRQGRGNQADRLAAPRDFVQNRQALAAVAQRSQRQAACGSTELVTHDQSLLQYNPQLGTGPVGCGQMSPSEIDFYVQLMEQNAIASQLLQNQNTQQPVPQPAVPAVSVHNEIVSSASNENTQNQAQQAEANAENTQVNITPPNNKKKKFRNERTVLALAAVLGGLAVALFGEKTNSKKKKNFDLGKIRGGQNFNDRITNRNNDTRRANNRFGKLSFLFAPFLNEPYLPAPETHDPYLEGQSSAIETTPEFTSGESAGFRNAHQTYSNFHPEFANELPRLGRSSGSARPSGDRSGEIVPAGIGAMSALGIVKALLEIYKRLKNER